MSFKIKTKIRRWLNKILHFDKPTSYPYISGDSFRSLAQHFYDEFSEISPKLVRRNDIIFVRGNFLKEYFKTIHPKINREYILISHNDDTNITEEYINYIDDKIIHWFAQNLCFEHKKVTPIPIGLQNFSAHDIGEIFLFDLINEKPVKNKIAYGFSEKSDDERKILAKILADSIITEKITEKNQLSYYKKINAFKFIASPEGRGIDCHRTWEAIYLGIIPILKSGPMSEYFKRIKLPLITVSNWNEVKSLNENILDSRYSEILNFSDTSPAFMDYWIKQIQKCKI